MGIIVAIVVVALAFDYINGFHDAANAIATVVSTRVLTPRKAVLWAGFFNFIAFVIFPLHVAHTIGKGIIDPAIIDDAVLLGALGGAIAWNLITWWYGLPSSSSHALVGGLLGAGISKGGLAVVQKSGVLKTAIFIVVSPMLGLVLGAGMMVAVAWLFRRVHPGRIDRWFRRLQLLSSALFSLGHGANDAQKTMGIIMAMLIAKGQIGAHARLPLWVILTCQAAMGLGTLTGGWRIVRTMGLRLTKLKPFGGFCAETGAASMLFLASALGVPVSTTHTITGAIVGVGWVNRPSGVRWPVALRIVWAWLFTIQSAALIAAAIYLGLRSLGM
ncbi:MAG TPA: inorganic phosphate transporter [Polyangia bacterium]|nr:inorganic phosphate transporter [Polyangia bacterium]